MVETVKYSDVVTKVLPAKRGTVEILHDTPTQFDRLRGMMDGMPLYRDKYVRLLVNGALMMTDAEFERRTNRVPVSKAKGDVLVAGLGIGLILDPLLRKCKSVTVIEKNPDVIVLVGPAYPEVTIIEADVFKWKPNGRKYDFIYFDIWADICTDYLKETERLEKRYRPSLRKGGRIDSWMRYALSSCRR